MIPTYAQQLGLQIGRINVWAKKIDDLSLEIFGMIIAGFKVINKLGRVWFFQETFLLATMKMVLGMPFLNFSNIDI